MDYISFMHVFDGLANLSHVVDNFGFGHCVSFRCDALKEFTSRQAEIYLKLIILDSNNSFIVQVVINKKETYNSKIRTISSSSSNASWRFISFG